MASPKPEKKLFLLDALALIYRAHFAFVKTPRINSKGMSTGATFGFVNTLLDVLNKERPTHIGVAFDTDVPTFRHEQYADYKGHRQAQPEDIQIARPYVRKILQGFGVPILELDGFEADDVIGTLAWKAADAGFEVFMMTPDKDYGQLVRDHVYLYKPSYQGKGVDVLGVPEILARWEIEKVSQVCDVLGLMGDASDNIPGVPGVGEKTAIKLVKEFGTVENLLEHAEEVKGKVGENLKNFEAQARLSKQLVCIDTNVPIPFDEEDLLISKPDEAMLKQIFEELEFRTMAERLFGDRSIGFPKPSAPAARATSKERAADSLPKSAQAGVGSQLSLFGQAGGEASDLPFIEDGAPVLKDDGTLAIQKKVRSIDRVDHEYHLINTPDQRKALVKFLLKQKEYCFDTETDSIEVLTANLVGLSFCYRKGEAYYIPVPDDREECSQILNDLRPALEDPAILKIGQNIKFDLMVLKQHGINMVGPFYDTMLAHYLIEPEQRHGMDTLAENYLGYTPIPITDLIGKRGKGQLTMREVPIHDVVEYASEDADITFQLKQLLDAEIHQMDLDELLHEVEVPLVPVLSAMEIEGVAIDPSALKELSRQLEGDILAAEAKVFEDAGERFNISSPLQLGKILFEKMNLDAKAKKTPSGQYATGEDVLNRLAEAGHKIARDIVEYRQLLKLKNTYIDALPELVNPRTGRVHTSFNQAVAATGRLSSTNPNLQNIPIRTERGREIRKAFIPRDKDHLLVSADYSQIELRIMASISEDETMMEAFRQNRDIHQITASRIYKVPLEEVTPEMRRRAKTANFGIIYGISSFGLSTRLNIPRAEASELIREYFKEFPAIKQYMDTTISGAREQEYVSTLLGRRRYIRDINSRNQTLQGIAERNAINAPIQGTAADMIKIAMIRIHNWLKESKLKTKMILQVHDELVFDAPRDEIEVIKEPIIRHMQQALLLKVPIEVGWGVGENWLEAH